MNAPTLTSREYARQIASQAPPLTEEQKAILRVLFRRPAVGKKSVGSRGAVAA